MLKLEKAYVVGSELIIQKRMNTVKIQKTNLVNFSATTGQDSSMNSLYRKVKLYDPFTII